MWTSLALIAYPKIDPIIFQLGPLAVRWYGVAYLLGFVASYLWLGWMTRAGLLRIKPDLLPDLISWLVVAVILGGRTGWWIFYHRSNASEPEPWYEPFAVWHGGMAFHGALLGVAVAMILWSRYRRAAFWNVADCAALVVPVGLFFGRIANFINGELYGRPSQVAWAMIFPTDPAQVPRHPSQLYEALLEGPVLLGLLWLARRWTHPRDGQIGALFVLLYGVLRFSVEFTREPDPQLGYLAFGWLTMGQVLSFVIVLIGAGLWIWRGRAAGEQPT